MSSLHQYPAISAHNEETEPDWISRLHEAFGVMCAIARMVWREETGYGSTEPGLTHTRWDGALIALRETSGQLEVIWATAPTAGSALASWLNSHGKPCHSPERMLSIGFQRNNRFIRPTNGSSPYLKPARLSRTVFGRHRQVNWRVTG
ncbi:hypothetical protein [Microvirga soli]|jgi:hypothetical protein|uniref:hypothetical protein n=1 Tax=Microvirga soli TaxID=1854496 RepID=UPI00191E9207|nr:hypothetical protein [Microvirga soli]